VLATAGVMAADSDREDTLKRAFAVEAGGRLVVKSDLGSVRVRGADTTEASLEVRRKVEGGSDARAKELLASHEVEWKVENGVVTLESRVGQDGRRGWRGPRLQVEIEAVVPHQFGVEVQTAGGSVSATQLKGSVSLRTAGGSVSMEEVTGDIQGRTAGGSIRGRQLGGEAVFTTAGGGIDIDGMSGVRLQAETSGGSIRLKGISVPVMARTAGGGIDVATQATPVEASTAGGSIQVDLEVPPKEGLRLKTSAGSITLRVPKESAFNLDAVTSAGGVRSDLPVSVRQAEGRSSLKGPVNGGGPEVHLRTSGGSIQIRER
jgi:DUF4097 and DUF4098 domain-containing protein YvlB